MLHRRNPISAALVGEISFRPGDKKLFRLGEKPGKPLVLFRPVDKNRNKPLVLDAMSLTSHDIVAV